jgi:hypothetical protein
MGMTTELILRKVPDWHQSLYISLVVAVMLMLDTKTTTSSHC